MTYLIAGYLVAMGLILGMAISLVYRFRKANQELAVLESAEEQDTDRAAAV